MKKSIVKIVLRTVGFLRSIVLYGVVGRLLSVGIPDISISASEAISLITANVAAKIPAE